MPQKGLFRLAVLGAVLVGVLALGVGLAARELKPSASSADEAECTDNDYRLAEQLEREPILTSLAPRTTIAASMEGRAGMEATRR
ncbi:hypothetical protein [Micromonospora sp. CB01531]|uniref:hypothetical protein n=1 Tax=Micromonospora sp. CB01531 TaxID=1718947 RepID=UPI000B2EFA9C|nr:hypothetical protein [Micromonospora sp. CB01531]